MKKYLSLICFCLTVGIIICISNVCIVAQQLIIKEQQLKNGLRVFFVEDHTAQKYLDSATLQIIAVGDAAKIRPALEKFGNVQLVEAK